MDDLVVRVKSPAMTAYVTCPLCHELLDEATTIPLCLHTFCRKCIHDMLSVKDVDSCPVCNTDLGCSPINKLRPDHALRSLRDKIFPQKNKETEISRTMRPVALPTKRKERSLLSPVTLPRVTGRRVASCHTPASIFEEHSPKSDDPSKDRLTEIKPAESPKKSGEGKIIWRSLSAFMASPTDLISFSDPLASPLAFAGSRLPHHYIGRVSNASAIRPIPLTDMMERMVEVAEQPTEQSFANQDPKASPFLFQVSYVETYVNGFSIFPILGYQIYLNNFLHSRTKGQQPLRSLRA